MKLGEEKELRKQGAEEIKKLGLKTLEQVQMEKDKVNRKLIKLHEEEMILNGKWSELFHLEKKLKILGLPIGSSVKYGSIPLYGSATKIAGKVGILKEKYREWVKVEFEGQVWNVKADQLVPADSKEAEMLTPGLVKQLSGVGKVMNEIMNKELERVN